jgi:hypothetical protein
MGQTHPHSAGNQWIDEQEVAPAAMATGYFFFLVKKKNEGVVNQFIRKWHR